MPYLVRYLEDNVYFVCTKINLRRVTNQWIARWIDGKFYAAEKLASLSNLRQIDAINLCENLNNGFPLVTIEKKIDEIKPGCSGETNIFCMHHGRNW